MSDVFESSRQAMSSDEDEAPRAGPSRARGRPFAARDGAASKRKRIAHSDDEDEGSGQEELELSEREGTVGRAAVVSVKRERNGKKKAVAESENEQSDSEAEGAENDDHMEYEDTEDIDEDGQVIRRRAIQRPVFIRGKDGYVSGSIVRISLYNFMTYEKCTIRPGPSLNMIIGPNGTGKSTISSAILIGLGFPPAFLGRSNKGTTGFIRLGQPFAETEIELRGKDGVKNMVIFRRFGIDKADNEFKIDGVAATKQRVVETVAELGIVANLCNYLPQDKVASFAAMQPPQLLLETMSAAGNPNLKRWHSELIVKGEAFEKLSDTLQQEREGRDKEQRVVDQLRPEKEQFEARKDLELRVRFCKIKFNWAHYTRRKAISQAKSEEFKQEHTRLARLKEKHKPLSQLSEVLKAHREELGEKLDDEDRQGRNIQEKMRVCRRVLDDQDKQDDNTQNSLDSLKRSAKDFRGKLRQEEARLEALKAIPQPAPRNETLEAAEKAKSKDLRNKQRDAQDEAVAIKRSQHELEQKAKRISEELTRHQDEIGAIKNITAQRRKALCDMDGSIAYTLQWYEENREEFEHEVFFPPALSADLTDPKYAAQVESCMTYSARNTFVCQSQQDFDRLSRHIGTKLPEEFVKNRNSKNATVRIHVSYIDHSRVDLNPEPPLTPEELATSGLDGYAIDFLVAPEPVLVFLRQNAQMHQRGVTIKPSSQVNDKFIRDSGKIVSYSTADSRNTVHFSRYGAGNMLETISLKQSYIFKKTIDKDAVARIEQSIQQGNEARRALEEDGKKLLQRTDANGRLQHKLREKMDALAEAAAERNSSLLKWSKTQKEINMSIERIANYKAKADIDDQAKVLKAKLLKSAKLRLENVMKYNNHFARACKKLDDIVRAGLEQCQTNANLDAVEAAFRERSMEIDALGERVAQLAAERSALKAEAQECHMGVQDRLNKLSNDLRARVVEEIRNDENGSVEQAEEALAEAQAELESNIGTDPRIIEKYDRHFDLLTEHLRLVAKLEVKHAKARRTLDSILSQFTPALEDLISVVHEKFSSSFEFLGCAGKVELNRVGDDYAQWGINIWVRYRDAADLELLTATRQSGGERAIATIAFLMSLTEMARVPFSLVDEINQGMDQRAERAVHNQLVKVTCDPQAGQYFLITPKLLTNLKYDPRMTVLNVFNGSYMGDVAPNAGNLKANLTDYRKRFKKPRFVSSS